MGEERLDLGLGEPVERFSLGYDVPYEFMVPLARSLACVDVAADGAFAAYRLKGVVGFVDMVQGLAFEDPFRDDGIHFRGRLVGYAFVGPRLVPFP